MGNRQTAMNWLGGVALVGALGCPAATAFADVPAEFGATTCSFVSYDEPGRKLTVRISSWPVKRRTYAAAALDKGAERGLWVQAGQDLGKGGDVAFEAYEFQGHALIYAAKNAGGRGFLTSAQKKAAKGKASSVIAASKAAVFVLCDLEVP